MAHSSLPNSTNFRKLVWRAVLNVSPYSFIIHLKYIITQCRGSRLRLQDRVWEDYKVALFLN